MTSSAMLKHRSCNVLYAAMIFLVLAASGCGKPQQPADKAEKIVEQFLDAWSRGEPPDSFAGPDHPIQGADPDWKDGRRLLSFLCAETKPSEMPDHFRCRVALALQDQKGKRWDKEVVYEVHMGEKNIIRRVSP